MIPVKIKVIGIMMLCGILLNGCTGSAYINNSTEQADIKLSGETFDVTADECIEILNEDIKKEELDLIPTEYEVDEQEDKIIYRCVINDILMIRFVSYKEYGSGVVRIALSRVDSVNYEKGEDSFNYEATKEDRKTAETYYEIICNNVQPKFNADLYLKSNQKGDTSEMNLDLGGLVFFGNIPSSDTWYGSETVEMYEVFSSEKLYEMYREDLHYDDDMFLYMRDF